MPLMVMLNVYWLAVFCSHLIGPSRESRLLAGAYIYGKATDYEISQFVTKLEKQKNRFSFGQHALKKCLIGFAKVHSG